MVLRLDVTSGTQTVHGSLQDEDGHRLSFFGWLELMEALQKLASRESATAEPADSAPEPKRRL